MEDQKTSGIIDDDTPTSRAFQTENIVPKWGQNRLDRDREPFTKKEIEIAESIGVHD
ncbi:hypothetical protein [Bradyrhizobium sp. UNPF46]|uniref:hypothetical protein n=1 Tax=Bradyrhizobium sp. UNPF46 TaxID=1141168 RepID=UPI0015F06C87|nr:hypothetical protein [Bradyrhizobium sp. UNPF46]